MIMDNIAGIPCTQPQPNCTAGKGTEADMTEGSSSRHGRLDIMTNRRENNSLDKVMMRYRQRAVNDDNVTVIKTFVSVDFLVAFEAASE